MEPIRHRLRLVAAAGLLAALVVAAQAADNDDTGPEPDRDELCHSVNSICEDACFEAKWTSSERAACKSRCNDAFDRCVRAAARGHTAVPGKRKQGLPALKNRD